MVSFKISRKEKMLTLEQCEKLVKATRKIAKKSDQKLTDVTIDDVRGVLTFSVDSDELGQAIVAEARKVPQLTIEEVPVFSIALGDMGEDGDSGSDLVAKPPAAREHAGEGRSGA